MKTLFRILTCLALLITGALASLQYLAVLPPGTIQQDWIIKGGIAIVILKGILEGITVIGDLADDGVRNGSFKPGFQDKLTRMLVMLLFVGMVSFMLASCVGGKFLGLDKAGWLHVGEGTGRETLKLLPAVTWEQYQKAKAEGKQPVDVQPGGIEK